MAINTVGKTTKRQLLENALARSQELQQFASNPQNFGSGYAGAFGAIAQGLTAGIGAYAEYKQRQQIAQLEADDIVRFSQFATEKGDTDLASIAGQLTPETRQAYYMQKTAPEMMGAYGVQAPASQREYEYFRKLAPAQQAQYLNLKRNIAGEGGIVRETGTIDTLQGYGVAGARRKGMEQTAQNVSDLTYKPQIAGKSTFASESAKTDVEAQDKASKTLSEIDLLDSTLKQLENHPGITDIIGAKGGGAILSYVGKKEPIAGTQAAGAKALLDQVKGQQFLKAFEDLKGGGQISEKEGETATKAQSAIGTEPNEKDFRKNVQTLRSSLATARNRIISRAGQGYQRALSIPQQTQSATQKTTIIKKYNPQTGRIE